MFAYRVRPSRIIALAIFCCLGLFILFYKNGTISYLSEYANKQDMTSGIHFPDTVYTNEQTTLRHIKERLTLPERGENFSPVIKQFLKGKSLNFTRLILQETAKRRMQMRDLKLTSAEQVNTRSCERSANVDRTRDYGKFFSGKTQDTRRNHHTYLDKNSLLMKVGGNWGWDAGNFSKLYDPRYIILEPLEDYVKILQKKFENKTNVNIYNLGLGAKNETIMVKIEGNNACATSKFSGKGGNVPIYIIEATSFMTYLGVGAFDVDLLTMNCEGCEYEALENILTSNIIERFKNIQWATHSTLKGLKDPIGRYCRIQALLSRTHSPSYQYKFNWESWRRKDLL